MTPRDPNTIFGFVSLLPLTRFVYFFSTKCTSSPCSVSFSPCISPSPLCKNCTFLFLIIIFLFHWQPNTVQFSFARLTYNTSDCGFLCLQIICMLRMQSETVTGSRLVGGDNVSGAHSLLKFLSCSVTLIVLHVHRPFMFPIVQP